MYSISEEYNKVLKSDEQQYDAYIILQDETKVDTDISGLKPIFNLGEKIIGNFATKRVEFTLFNTSKYNITNQEIEVFVGLKVGNEVIYNSLGKFICDKPVIKDENLDECTITAQNYSLKFKVPYTSVLTFPCTIKEGIKTICEHLNIPYIDNEFINQDYVLKEFFIDEDATFFDVIKVLVEAGFANANIDNTNSLIVKSPSKNVDYSFDINELFELKKEDNKFGPINSIVASRIVASDGSTTEDVFARSETSIAKNGLYEYKIKQNDAIDYNRQTAVDNMLEGILDFEYTPAYVESVYNPAVEIGDMLEVPDLKTDTSFLLFAKELSADLATGLMTIESTEETQTETDYKSATNKDKRRKTEAKVDKMAGEIILTTQKVEQVENTANTAKNNADNANNKIDNLEIGGVNLILESKDFTESDNYWYVSPVWKKSVDENGFTVLTQERTGSTATAWARAIPHKFITKEEIEDAKNGIIVSFDLKIEDTSKLTDGRIVTLQIYKNDGTRIGWYEGQSILEKQAYTTNNGYNKSLSEIQNNTWTRVSVRFTQSYLKTISSTVNATVDDIAYTSISFQLVRDGKISIRKPKMEFGNKATDWTPAPEDVQNEIDETNSAVEDTRAKADEALNNADEALNNANEALKNTETIAHIEKQKNVQIEASEGVLENTVIYGDSKQATRSGDNLYNVKDKRSFNAKFVTVDSDDWITITCDNTILETKQRFINFFTNKCEKLKTETNYYCVLEIKNINGNGRLNLVNNDDSQGQFSTGVMLDFTNLSEGKYIYTIKTKTAFENSISMLRSFIYCADNWAGSITLRISLLEKQPNLDTFVYEKYGAMPSPQFPSDIINVGSNVNWLDLSAFQETTSAGVTLTKNNDGSLHLQGKTTSISRFKIPYTFEQKWLGKTLILSSNIYVSANSWNVGFKKKDGSNVFVIVNSKSRKLQITQEIINNINNFDIYIKDVNMELDLDLYIKLEEGDKPTDFTKYGCGGVYYKTIGKNMLPFPYTYATSRTINGVNFTINEDGTIIVNGTATGPIEFLLYGKYNSEDNIKNFENFTLTGLPGSASVNTYFFAIWQYENGKNISAKNYVKDAKIVTENNADGICIALVVKNGASLNNVIFKPMVLRNADDNSDMTYEAYKEHTETIELSSGIELCKVGDIQDYIDSNGVIHKKIGKLVLDGTETITVNNEVNNVFKINNVENAYDNNTMTLKNAICTHFKEKIHHDLHNGIVKKSFSILGNTAMAIYFGFGADSTINSIEKFREFLQEEYEKGTPVTVLYGIEEDTTQSLADTEIAKLQSLKLFYGINNITITAETSFDYLTTSPLNDIYETKNNANRNYTTINKQYTEIKTTTEGVTTQITDITQSIENSTGEIETIKSDIYNLQQTTAGMEQTLTQQGGSNLLLNSSGLFDNEYWEGTVKSLTNTDIQNNFIAKACFSLQSGTIKQSIKVTNGAYYVGFKYQKLIELANCKLKINDVEVNLTNTELTEVDKIINVSEHNITIELISDTNDACLVGDIIIAQGTKQSWSSNMNEIYTATVKIGVGLEIISNTMKTKLLANADGVRIVNTNNNEVVAEFTDMGMTTKEITANKGKIAGLLIQQVGNQVWLSNILGGS